MKETSDTFHEHLEMGMAKTMFEEKMERNMAQMDRQLIEKVCQVFDYEFKSRIAEEDAEEDQATITTRATMQTSIHKLELLFENVKAARGVRGVLLRDPQGEVVEEHQLGGYRGAWDQLLPRKLELKGRERRLVKVLGNSHPCWLKVSLCWIVVSFACGVF